MQKKERSWTKISFFNPRGQSGKKKAHFLGLCMLLRHYDKEGTFVVMSSFRVFPLCKNVENIRVLPNVKSSSKRVISASSA